MFKIKRIHDKGIEVFIYEPQLNTNYLGDIKVIHDFEEFKNISDLIVTNRKDKSLKDVSYKCFSRDLFGKDWYIKHNGNFNFKKNNT